MLNQNQEPRDRDYYSIQLDTDYVFQDYNPLTTEDYETVKRNYNKLKPSAKEQASWRKKYKRVYKAGRK